MKGPFRRFWVGVDTLAIPYVFGIAVAVVAGRYLPAFAAIPVAVLVTAALVMFTAFMSLDEDDWWNDFRSQDRILFLGGLAGLVGPGLGVWCGLTL